MFALLIVSEVVSLDVVDETSLLRTNLRFPLRKCACSWDVCASKKCSKMICYLTRLTTSKYRSTRRFPWRIFLRLLLVGRHLEKSQERRSVQTASFKGTLLEISLCAACHTEPLSDCIPVYSLVLTLKIFERRKLLKLTLVSGTNRVWPINFNPSRRPPMSPRKSRKL